MNHLVSQRRVTRVQITMFHDFPPRWTSLFPASISLVGLHALPPNVRETLYVWHACGRAKRIILSLARYVSLRVSSSLLNRGPRFSRRVVGNKALRRITGPLGARVKCCSRTVVDHTRCRPISLLGFVRIEYLSLASIKSRPRLDPIP